MSLNAKQKRFSLEYLKDFNGTQAAIRSGYSPKTAASQAFDLLRKPEIKQFLNEFGKKIEDEALVTVNYVITGIKEVAERCLQRKPVMVFDKEEKAYKQAVDEATGEGIWEFDSTGANKALENLGRFKKIFTDRVEVTEVKGKADRLRAARMRAHAGR